MLGLEKRRTKALSYDTEVRKDFKLLEVDEQLLSNIVDGRVVLKGNPASEAVLCTEDNTYALRMVETTNSLLLAPANEIGPQRKGSGSEGGVLVVASAGSHLELMRIAPKFADLDRLLQGSVYTLDQALEENEQSTNGDRPEGMDTDEDHHGGLSFESLLQNCQASRGELQAALRERCAVEINGRWQLVDEELLSSLLEIIIYTAQENEWPLDAMPEAEAMEAIVGSTYDARIVRACWHRFGKECRRGFLALDEGKVCLHLAEKILSSKPQWTLAAFLEAWKEAVPEGMGVNQQMLAGEALIDTIGAEQVITSFPSRHLPRDPEARFTSLFKARTLWPAKDLMPFLNSMQAPGVSTEALLLKYCRASQPNPQGQMLYSAR